MEKSGPRHTAMKSPIIERSDLQSPRQRTLYGALTLAFWAFWFYLWLPVLALLVAVALALDDDDDVLVKVEDLLDDDDDVLV